MVKRPATMADRNAPLTALDFKFHFYPWWTDDGYVLDGDVTETSEMAAYFAKLEQQGVNLSREQRAWYVKKAEQQGDKMRQEFPSTPDEAFEAAVEGAYFGPQMRKMRAEGRICRIPMLDKPVYTTWDLGINDDMTITFWQDVGLSGGPSTITRTAARASPITPGADGQGLQLLRPLHAARRRSAPAWARTPSRPSSTPRSAGSSRCGCSSASRPSATASGQPLAVAAGVDRRGAVRSLIACLDGYRREWDDKLGGLEGHAGP
jgi:hypothetical protein